MVQMQDLSGVAGFWRLWVSGLKTSIDMAVSLNWRFFLCVSFLKRALVFGVYMRPLITSPAQ